MTTTLVRKFALHDQKCSMKEVWRGGTHLLIRVRYPRGCPHCIALRASGNRMCRSADVRMCKMRTNSADIIWKCDGKVQRYVCGKSILLCLLLYSSKHTAIQLYPMTQSTICLWQLSSLCFNAQSSSSKDIVVVVTIVVKGRSRRWRCRHRQRRRKIAHAVTWWSTSQLSIYVFRSIYCLFNEHKIITKLSVQHTCMCIGLTISDDLTIAALNWNSLHLFVLPRCVCVCVCVWNADVYPHKHPHFTRSNIQISALYPQPLITLIRGYLHSVDLLHSPLVSSITIKSLKNEVCHYKRNIFMRNSKIKFTTETGNAIV